MKISVAVIGIGGSGMSSIIRALAASEAREVHLIVLADALEIPLERLRDLNELDLPDSVLLAGAHNITRLDIPPGVDQGQYLRALEVAGRMEPRRHMDEFTETGGMGLVRAFDADYLEWDWSFFYGKSREDLATEKESYRYIQPIYTPPGRMTHNLRPFRAARSFRNKKEGTG